ncbi:DUF4268 domain-containing protein [Plastoroseomonas hellenica]|uniref:DUF4268 domain-containing protein n=1 Tax=Plastoroseomonas hellenica TaxID=2687306 RepID=UPI001BA4AF8F|nr:DUF4268 domain-containing protein [Plastoroseomonas hellenica]MBR0642928.1 DUF4268 domain-containing protein [Plastoroseomonas hellenica]
MPTIALGKLEQVEPRSLWPLEAVDFTPWLAENLDALGEALGIDLEKTRVEAPVGSFACDIEARDTNSNRRVIVENQLSETDHRHLGQLITYAAGLDAGVIVWIASRVREEHREAIDFLNRHTNDNLDFFLVTLEVIRISGSLPAVVFNLTASPNAWAKTASLPSQKLTSERTLAYQEFYQGLMDELREKHRFTNARAAQPQSWYAFSSGTSGITYNASFASGRRLRAELYIDVGEIAPNKSIFDNLKSQETQIESALGERLLWERLDGKRACRISAIRENTTIIDAAAQGDEIREWLVQHLLQFKAVFGPLLKAATTTIPAPALPSVST